MALEFMQSCLASVAHGSTETLQCRVPFQTHDRRLRIEPKYIARYVSPMEARNSSSLARIHHSERDVAPLRV
jgi:hypothetical protein